MKTIKDLKAQLKELEDKRYRTLTWDVDHDPRVEKAQRAFDKVRGAVAAEAQKKAEAMDAEIEKLEADLEKAELEKAAAIDAKDASIPVEWQKFVDSCYGGVNYGGQLKVAWVSPSGRYALITNPGSSVWSGRGLARSYHPTEHILMDITLKARSDHGYEFYTGHQVRVPNNTGGTNPVSIVGRLDKTKVAEIAERYK